MIELIERHTQEMQEFLASIEGYWKRPTFPTEKGGSGGGEIKEIFYKRFLSPRRDNSNLPPTQPKGITVSAPANVIRKIRDCIRLLEAHATPALDQTLSRRETTLRHSAINEFAALNGWKAVPSDKSFPPEKIGHRNRGERWSLSQQIFDHVIYFRAAGKNAAIVTQPYNNCRREANILAKKLGLALHIPPNPKASFHYPGHTFFFVFTLPNCTVNWLPEQMKAPVQKKAASSKAKEYPSPFAGE